MAESNYSSFDKWIMPILKKMLEEQNTKVSMFILAFKHELLRSSKTKLHISHDGNQSGELFSGHFLAGCSMDSFQDDPPTGPGNQQPGIHLLLGLQSKCCTRCEKQDIKVSFIELNL